MFALVLQLWGGIFFLLNKVFFSLAERGDASNRQQWRIWSWVVYLIGLPAWVIIFVQERNWIAAALEVSGAPSMVLGLFIAWRGFGNQPKWLDYLSMVGIIIGFGASLYNFGGFTTFQQWLELGIAVGYLVGTRLLAKQTTTGYLWYILMHLSCGALMWFQGYPWLTLQQILSLAFIVDAYMHRHR